MSDFIFDEGQEILRQQVKEFVAKELKPRAKELNSADRPPADLLKRLGDMGYLGLVVPEEYGGQPVDNPHMAAGIIVEEISRCTVAFNAALIECVAYERSIMQCCEEVRQEWLVPIVKGIKTACVALTEPDTGSDATAIKTTAIKKGDYYIVNGEKTSVSMGHIADLCVAWVRTDPSNKGPKGVSTLLIPLDSPGVEKTRYEDMGWHNVGRAAFFFDDVKVPARNLVGKEGEGFSNAMNSMNVYRTCLMCWLVGQSLQSLEDAMDYAKQRMAFGRPIAKFESVSHRLMDSIAKIEALKMMAYKSLWTLDQGQPAAKAAAMAKAIGPAIAIEAINNAYLTFGHVGFSTEHAIEQRLRDAYGIEFADGSCDILRNTLVREIMGKEYLHYT